ncbi:MAG TPA: anthranilate synthase component I family protein [Polyangiaceae bacterium]|nr:anthranilate synthase component I family protein [Polyangiaceae bacterium]
MTLVARELPLPPRPLALARRLADSPRLALFWSASGAGPSFIAPDPIAESDAIDPEPSLTAREGRSELESVPRWAGFIPYEALRDIERPSHVPANDSRAEPQLRAPCWWRLGAVVCVGERVTVVGDDAARVEALSARLLSTSDPGPSPVSLELLPGEPPARHAERVRAALELIRQGQIYQVNLARRLELAVRGDAVDLLDAMCVDTRPPYAAAFRWGDTSIVSSTPELLLEHRAGGRIWTDPIKGTRPRGQHAASDRAACDELELDPKERAELSMIVDVERNDVGKVSAIGTVRARAPRLTTHGLVWHRQARVSGVLAPELTRCDSLRALLPSGSVTGAPKVRAMEIIAALEAERRGLYTGALGFITQRGEMTLAMAIRTLTTRAGEGHYFTGGGIVADSDPAREVEETVWKAQQLFGRAGRVRAFADSGRRA